MGSSIAASLPNETCLDHFFSYLILLPYAINGICNLRDFLSDASIGVLRFPFPLLEIRENTEEIFNVIMV
jgi:hypothetical protein